MIPQRCDVRKRIKRYLTFFGAVAVALEAIFLEQRLDFRAELYQRRIIGGDRTSGNENENSRANNAPEGNGRE